MPTNDTSPPRMSSAEVTTITRWKPSTSSAPARITPIIAVAMSPATRETALLTAEPMPAWVDGIEAGWERQGVSPAPYAAGTWGPSGAFALTERQGHTWYD